jgi:hypothetical protein
MRSEIFIVENRYLATPNEDFIFIVVETPFYLQSVSIHSANWCEDLVLWLGKGHSLVPFRSY